MISARLGRNARLTLLGFALFTQTATAQPAATFPPARATAEAAPLDPALAADRGQIRTWFVPLATEESERRQYGVAVDHVGRILIGNGQLLRYDGTQIERLPRPADTFTTALAVDASRRLWTGNAEELGYLEEITPGAWKFTSLKPQLPAALPAYDTLLSVHCIDDAVIFVTPHTVLRWRGQRFEHWRVNTDRRVPARTAGDLVVLVETPTSGNEPSRLLTLSATGEPQPIVLPAAMPRPTFATPRPHGGWLLSDARSGQAQWFDANGSLEKTTAHPAWKLHPMAAVARPEGWIFGCAGGLMSFDYEGRLRFAISARTTAVPSVISEVLAATPDGHVWSVNSFGLLGADPQAVVTLFATAQGVVDPITTLRRVGDEVWLAGPRGLIILGASGNPPAAGRMTPGEDLPGLSSNSLTSSRTIEVNDDYAFVAANTFATMSHATRQWTQLLNGTSVRARSLSAPWPTLAPDLLLGATDSELLLFGPASAQRPVLWRQNFPGVERVYPLPSRQALLADRAGQLWLLAWQVDAAGHWSLASAPTRLTPERGLGRILRVDQLGADTWVYTRDGAWFWHPGAERLGPATTDAATGVELAALARHTDGRTWALARTAPFGVSAETSAAYALWPVSAASGQVTGLASPPHAVVDQLGTLNDAFFEPAAPQGGGALWWLAGTQGVARISLDASLRAQPLNSPPRLTSARDGLDHLLPRGPTFTLGDERSLLTDFNFTTLTHPLPVAYQTKLDGLDPAWSLPTPTPRRAWDRLPPGRYTLRVRAVDTVGQLSPELVQPVHVPPRFAETPEFWAVFALGFVGVGGVAFRWWMLRIARRESALEATISERTAALLATNKELQHQSSQRAELVGVIAHELRTPLIGVGFIAQRIRRQLAHSPAAADAHLIETQLDQLRHLLDGTLDLTRFELGLIPVHWQAVQWSRFVEELTAGHASAAANKKLHWQLACENSAPPWLLTDAGNHRRAVHNLISNAIKYTAQGALRITVTVRTDAAQMTWAKWVIEDTGPGLPPEILSSLAAHYQRPGLSPSPLETPSSGLGLALTARLVKLAGGRLLATSRAGGGTIFSLSLPMLALNLPADHDDPLDFPPPFDLRALVVEDDAPQRAHLTDLLEPLGVQVDLAPSCAVAEELAARHAYDVAFLDFNLPDGTGLELLRRLRAGRRQPRFVAMVTAHDNTTIRAACIDAGCDVFLSKPLSVHDALTALARASGSHRSRVIAADGQMAK